MRNESFPQLYPQIRNSYYGSMGYPQNLPTKWCNQWLDGVSPQVQVIPTSPNHQPEPTGVDRRGKLEMLTETGTLCLLEVWTWTLQQSGLRKNTVCNLWCLAVKIHVSKFIFIYENPSQVTIRLGATSKSKPNHCQTSPKPHSESCLRHWRRQTIGLSENRVHINNITIFEGKLCLSSD